MKQRIYEIVDGVKPGDRGAALYNVLITGLVLLTLVTIFLETFQGIAAQLQSLFALLNILVIIPFTIDYFLRVWTADVKHPELSRKDAIKAYVFSGYGIVDALATFPPYLSVLFKVNLSIFQLLRLFRLFKIPQLEAAGGLFAGVFKRKRSELLMTFTLVFFLIYLCAMLMFYVEHPAQPDVFSDGGKSLWWAVITLTTIGYGDMYPITPLGHTLGGIVALLGIGVIALPTGILSSGLMEELNARRAAKRKADAAVAAAQSAHDEHCPHCGQVMHTAT